jgi:hypothetical protein
MIAGKGRAKRGTNAAAERPSNFCRQPVAREQLDFDVVA